MKPLPVPPPQPFNPFGDRRPPEQPKAEARLGAILIFFVLGGLLALAVWASGPSTAPVTPTPSPSLTPPSSSEVVVQLADSYLVGVANSTNAQNPNLAVTPEKVLSTWCALNETGPSPSHESILEAWAKTYPGPPAPSPDELHDELHSRC